MIPQKRAAAFFIALAGSDFILFILSIPVPTRGLSPFSSRWNPLVTSVEGHYPRLELGVIIHTDPMRVTV
jgi:hypothetical protein